MTISSLTCMYCAHRNSGADSRCAHCGAPLSHPEPVAPPLGKPQLVEELGKDAITEGEKLGIRQLRRWQWQVIGAGVIALSGILVASIHSCTPFAPPGSLSDIDVLPPALRAASSCDRPDPTGAVDKCVIAADGPLLVGGIAGGQALTCYVQVEPRDRVTATISRWRVAGGSVLSDGTIFVAIGPSSNVWYADTRTGLELETGTFTGPAAAQAFLLRSGLTL